MTKRANAKRIGYEFELEMVNTLLPIFPDVKRGGSTQYGRVKIPDIAGTPFWIECKSWGTVYPKKIEDAHYKAWGEYNDRVDEDSYPFIRGYVPVVLIYKDKRPGVKKRTGGKKRIMVVMAQYLWWKLSGLHLKDIKGFGAMNQLTEVSLDDFLEAIKEAK